MRAHAHALESDDAHTRVPVRRPRPSTVVGFGRGGGHAHAGARPRPQPSRVPVGRLRPSTVVGLVGALDPVHEAEASGSQGVAPPPQAAVQVLVPNVLDVLNQFGIPLRELEMRMLDPQGVIMGVVYGDPIPALEGMNLAQVYQWLTANFTSACGDTANLLRETTFPDSGAELSSPHNLTEVVAELRQPEDANIRINSLGGTCFFRRAARWQLPDPAELLRSLRSGRLGRRRRSRGRNDQRPPRNWPTACRPSATTTSPTTARAAASPRTPTRRRCSAAHAFAARDIRDDGVNLRGEVVTNVRPEDEQHGRAKAQLDRFAPTWDEIRTSTLTPVWPGRLTPRRAGSTSPVLAGEALAYHPATPTQEWTRPSRSSTSRPRSWVEHEGSRKSRSSSATRVRPARGPESWRWKP